MTWALQGIVAALLGAVIGGGLFLKGTPIGDSLNHQVQCGFQWSRKLNSG